MTTPRGNHQNRTNRRGCYVVAAVVVLVLLLFLAVGMNWFGQVDTGKMADLPVAGQRPM